jgi:uncharacterized protein
MRLFFTLLAIFLGLSASSQSTKYNKQLADSLGANNNGMKKYVFVVLKTGSNTTTDKSYIDSMFKGHMINIEKNAAEGKLIVAGPFKKNEQAYRGIFILNVATLEEANAIVQRDPAVKSDLLKAELFEWYGSAALPMYLQYHDLITKPNQ